MLVSIQDLRSIQERCEIGELVQRLDVSIDRLTVIWDTDTGSLRRIFKNLKQAISTKVDSFEIYDNVRDDVFTLAKVFNEYDSINIIFFQLFCTTWATLRGNLFVNSLLFSLSSKI